MYVTKEWTCNNCKIKFRGKRNTKNKNVFCSTDCHRNYRWKTAKPKIKIIDNNTTIMYIKDKKVLIDKEDIPKLKSRVWNINKHGYVIGWDNKRENLEYMHRVIMNPSEDKDIDHINRNKLDNRKLNLRECEDYENLRNTKIYSNNKSGVKGVSYNNNVGKWVARIGYKGKSIFLGYYNSLELAKNAREKAEVEYHGKYRSRI